VVEQMLKNPEKLKLGGEKKDLTVLFSDIRGFTSISEHMTPETLVKFLNEYLTKMTDIV
jgi:adenylate cyclase